MMIAKRRQRATWGIVEQIPPNAVNGYLHCLMSVHIGDGFVSDRPPYSDRFPVHRRSSVYKTAIIAI